MQTDRIKVASDGTGREDALNEVEKFASYVGLETQDTLRLRLLAEETMGMVSAITHEFKADYWLEKNEDGACIVHLKADTPMSMEKREQLLEVSTSGKNEATKGFMGKIRNIFQNGVTLIEDANKASMEQGGYPFMFFSMGAVNYNAIGAAATAYDWSLSKYRENVESSMDENPEAKEAWDELETSIVASLADEVKVSIQGNIVELTIEKKF